MRGFFPVDIRDEKSTGMVIDYSFLFKSPGVVSPADLADCIGQSLRRVLFPDALVFVCIPNEVKQIKVALKKYMAVTQALERASSKVCVAVCEIDRNGRIGNPSYIKNTRACLSLIETGEQKIIFQKGISQLFESSNVLCPAPTGFAFVKSSKRRSKYFLRADAAFCETERVHFFAYAFLEKIAQREAETKEPVEVIFIDTMAIASLAYVLRELYHELYDKPRPRVESFHSYEGMKNVPIPRFGTSLCIISASQTMSMQRDWQKLTRCSPAEVFTLIAFQSAQDSDQAVYAFDRADLLSGNEDLSGLRDLRMFGENFAPEDVKLKPVLLNVKAHRDKEWFEVGQESGYAENCDHSIAVLLTVAAMLQRAREFNKFENDGDRLASDTFQQVVLDPENFARYNDGLIQAALLRAADPAELDYSSSEEVSHRMADLLASVFRHYSRQQGEAALEFAFAIKAKRLKLAEKDVEYLKDEVKALSGGGKYLELLKSLLDVSPDGAWNPEVSI